MVFILADDLGWSELGAYGNRFNETPHLDHLAEEGLRFTQAYASAPVCSPYRASLMTGQYPARIGIVDYLRPNSANALSTDFRTLPEMLKRDGYTTGMIGKWHLTGYKHHGAEHEIAPSDHGFTWETGRELKGVGNGANFWPYVFRKQEIRWINFDEPRLGADEFLVDRMNLEAVDFIKRNRDRPFFLYLSHFAPHSILHGKPELVAKYIKKHPPGKSTRDRCYLCQDEGHARDVLHHWAGDHNPHLAAMLESIDNGVGLILEELDRLGLSENTIVIFTSDNGGETNVTSNAPHRGGKSELYEGGIRVPLIVRWPGQVLPGTISEQPTVNVDFYPTLLEAAGIESDPDQVFDGESILPLWKNPQASSERGALFWHYPLDRPHFLGGRSAGAIRDGDWKLIEFFDTGATELYSLAEDPSEQHDLSEKNPKRVAMLQTRLKEWRTSVEARIPSPPLLTQSRQLSFADHFSPGQVSSRWFFTKDWSAEEGALQRKATGSDTTRIFLKDAEFRDVVIRFDFQFRDAHELRFVTGGDGHYNAVLHLHRDHFFLQTALDKTGPYFSRRHAECAYEFDPDRWYTMTVEFLGDELVAHVDQEHLVYAKHPILDKVRKYFAFQVDESAAAFDNVNILNAVKHSDYTANLQKISNASGKHPVEMPLEERLKIEKTNAHDRLYQSDEQYRKLVTQVQELDEKNKKRYPDVFRSHKEFKTEISEYRQHLHQNDPRYKELLFATYRANRALDEFLLEQEPSIAEFPHSRKPAELERVRRKFQNDPGYQKRLRDERRSQQALEAAYPKLFTTDERITEFRNARRKEVEKEDLFRRLIDDRAQAWRDQQDYLFANDAILSELNHKVNSTDSQ